MMVVLGTDAHKRSHTMVAVGEGGAELGSVTVGATSEGHLKALKWAGQWVERRWAIEDCRQLSCWLESDLLAAGELVTRVPPKMMAGVRRSARTRGKSDPIDALAVARAALAEPGLPLARLDGPAREVKLVVDYRERLIRERTGAQNSLRWRLHELEPGFDPPPGSLDRYRVLDLIEDLLTGHSGLVADLARREVARIRDITREANQLEKYIAVLVANIGPCLLEIEGCGALTAGKLIGEAADISRFTSRDAYAAWNGTAPIPVWSSNNQRFRLNRGGNRQTNAALHRIAITQVRIHQPAQDLVARHMAAGKTKSEARRILKRRLSDRVHKAMLHDANNQPQTTTTRAA